MSDDVEKKARAAVGDAAFDELLERKLKERAQKIWDQVKEEHERKDAERVAAKNAAIKTYVEGGEL
jgi:hypothetical protein